MKIGWIGLGNMGVPMASNLLQAGYELYVWNRTPERTVALLEKGAKNTDSLAHLVEICDVLFTMVSDDAAVKEIYTGLRASSPQPACRANWRWI
ncbi:NAD(P)-binding domain-containing protein [Brevibacillus invocatus]|uniref:NAD(P)-binding domain-containing protein n=1 Tax=Brevibacillus invocatus TaxID=173959 RepID=UPI00203ED1C2|nr:NAD(P)-binding domain-containing protein [Brevibacillus invocatus]MCM3080384.1 NAD(P)-binding domain-containing protein [Brevibacillus invocatus]